MSKMPRKTKPRPAKVRKKRKRPYTRDKTAHKIRRRRTHYRHEVRRETKMMNYLLNQMLKTMSAPADTYHYHPRHHSKDREYKFSSDRQQQFKKGFPAPDVNFWRPPGPADSGTWTAAPYRGNIHN